MQIELHDHGKLPLYLQIKYQISHQISAQQLPPGARLPTVRELAQRLQVNPNTVALAYRELQADGLVEAFPRRGTFVRSFSPSMRSQAERHTRLSDTLRQAYQQARALGFSETEIAQRFLTLASQGPAAIPLLFVDQSSDVVGKYSGLIEEHLGDGVRVTGLTMDQLRQADQELRDRLERCYYVLAFPRNATPLTRLLPKVTEAFEVVTVASLPLPETVSALSALKPDARLVLLTENRFLNPSLSLVRQHTGLSIPDLTVFTHSDPQEAILEALAGADLLLYGFTSAAFVAGLETEVPRMELRYGLAMETVEQLRLRFGLDEVFAAG